MKLPIKKLGIGTGLILGAFVVLWLMVAAVSLAHAAPQSNKQVYCNQEGDSGKWKAQISNGNTEHEKILTGVFVHDQNDVTSAMDDQCQTLYGQPPVVDVCVNLDGNQATVPVGTWLNDKGACVQIQLLCPAGQYEIDKDVHGNVICKDNPTGCPYGDSIPVDSPKCVAPQTSSTVNDVPTDPVTGEVFYGK